MIKKLTVLFEWDDSKNELNIKKHNVSFFEAQKAFIDPHRVIAEDLGHSFEECRYYCFGMVNAGYWRKGRKIYEEAKKSKIH